MFPVNRHYNLYIVSKAAGNLASEASRTYLSFLWWLLDPILSMIVYYLVFGMLLQRGTEDFVAFLLIGVLTWHWFAQAVTNSMGAMQNAAPLISKHRFPKILLPSVTVLTVTIKFLIAFSLLQVFLLIYGIQPSVHIWAVLPLLLLQFLLVSACAYLSCLLTTFIPDFKFIIPNLMRFGLFLSGVFYSIDQLPEQYQRYFDFNPMAVLLTSYRDALMYHQWPDIEKLLPILAFAALLYVCMVVLYRRLGDTIPRILMQA